MPIKITFSDKTAHVAVYVNGQIESLVTELPKRPWVGLTEEEVKECFTITPDLYLPWQIYKRIESNLMEKNT